MTCALMPKSSGEPFFSLPPSLSYPPSLNLSLPPFFCHTHFTLSSSNSKLINKSVRNTVDLRALTIMTPSMSTYDREEAIQEDMLLTIESARAIGCRVTDSTGDLIIRKDPPTIRSFLVDLIRVGYCGNELSWQWNMSVAVDL